MNTRIDREEELPEEGQAFEALLNRNADRVMNWLFARLAQRPKLCVIIADLLRRSEEEQRKK